MSGIEMPIHDFFGIAQWTGILAFVRFQVGAHFFVGEMVWLEATDGRRNRTHTRMFEDLHTRESLEKIHSCSLIRCLS
eukprot:22995_6